MSILAELASGATGGIFGGIGSLVKDIREAVKGKELSPETAALIEQKAMDLEAAATQAQMQMITAEANSQDKWTSRARPMFMYVFYLVLLCLIIVAPIIGIFFPQHMTTFFANVKSGFDAIPDSLYQLFGVGYLGYTGARTWEKKKGAGK